MADAHHDDAWRKNIPADFDGRQGNDWDDEIDVSMVYKSAVAIVIAVAVAFGFCWLLIDGFEAFSEEPQMSPLAEAHLRHLPPSPQLQPTPEGELDAMRAEMAGQTEEYGWADQLNRRVHIPVQKAMDLVLAQQPKATSDKPAAADVVVPAEPAAHGAAAQEPAAHEPAAHESGH